MDQLDGRSLAVHNATSLIIGTVHRLSGQTLKNMSRSGEPCHHEHRVPHPSATYIEGLRPQTPSTANFLQIPNQHGCTLYLQGLSTVWSSILVATNLCLL
jgi:hypothetical protein